MAKASRTYAAVVIALPLLGTSLPLDNANAGDNCAAAPGATAPKGQHWNYHIDWAKHRKCWYLRAIVPVSSRVAAKPPAAHAESVPSGVIPTLSSAAASQAANAVSAIAPETLNAPSSTTGHQPPPHVTEVAQEIATAPTIGATSPFEMNTAEQKIEAPTAQILSSDANESGDRANPSTATAEPKTAYDALLSAIAEPEPPAQTQPWQTFFLLVALTFGIATALLAFFSKMIGLATTPQLLESYDRSRRRYRVTDRRAHELVLNRDDAPFLAPQEIYGEIDFGAIGAAEEQPAKPECAAVWAHDGEPRQSEPVGLTRNRDIELMLNVLRRARQEVILTANSSGR